MVSLVLSEEFDVGVYEVVKVVVEWVMGLSVQFYVLLVFEEQGIVSERIGYRNYFVGLFQVVLQIFAIFSGEYIVRFWVGEDVRSVSVNFEVVFQGLGLGKFLFIYGARQGVIWWVLVLQRVREREVVGGQFYRVWGVREVLYRLYKGFSVLVQGQQSGFCEVLFIAFIEVYFYYFYQDICRQRIDRERYRIRWNEI